MNLPSLPAMRLAFVRASVGTLTLLCLLAGTARAQTTANGPYYATPSWDQTMAPNIRYVVLSNFNNDAVLDRETGLVWQRTVNGERFWPTASAGCLNITIGNRAGWRLPTVNEVASVFDLSMTTTSSLFFSGHPFFAELGTRIWTATPNPAGGHRLVEVHANVFGQMFYSLDSTAEDGEFAGYWCVRGGLTTGPQ